MMHEERTYSPATIMVHLQPEMKTLTLPRPKSVLQLLKKLDLRMGSALVIRNGELLTQDREVCVGDEIIVRIVTSSG